MKRACGSDPTDLRERRDRFAEEAIEVMQGLKMTAEECHRLVDYVHDRPVGDVRMEIGAAQFTLALLGAWIGVDIAEAGERELLRVDTPDSISRLRLKRAARHGRGPLPGDDSAAGQSAITQVA